MNFGSQTGRGLASPQGSQPDPNQEKQVFRSFFMTRRWCAWSIPGGALILFATWYKVELDVRINAWFGDFYNLIQKALGEPNSVALEEYNGHLATFGYIAGLYVIVAVFTDFF